jgi:hypothetical protein
VERDTHRRFLEYLEAFPYWNAPSNPKLTRDDFVELDVELAEFERRGRASWSEDDAKRVVALKRKLLRD